MDHVSLLRQHSLEQEEAERARGTFEAQGALLRSSLPVSGCVKALDASRHDSNAALGILLEQGAAEPLLPEGRFCAERSQAEHQHLRDLYLDLEKLIL